MKRLVLLMVAGVLLVSIPELYSTDWAYLGNLNENQSKAHPMPNNPESIEKQYAVSTGDTSRLGPKKHRSLNDLRIQYQDIIRQSSSVPDKMKYFQDRLDFIKHEIGPYDHPAGPPEEPTESFRTGLAKGLKEGVFKDLKAVGRLICLKTKAETMFIKPSKTYSTLKPNIIGRGIGKVIGTAPIILPSLALGVVSLVFGGAALATTVAALYL